MNVLLGITGGIAAYKAADLASALVKDGHSVRVVLTENATRFVGPATFDGLTGEPTMTDTFGDAMAHIEWAKWADVACVAPLTANTMAKLACGLASDALTTVLMAIPTPEPIVGRAQLAHVGAVAVIAGDSRTRQLHPDILEARPVVVDILEQAERSGEFRYAREQNARDRIKLARADDGAVLTMGDAANGRVPQAGGTAYLTGMAAQDLCVAAMIYEEIRP